MSRGRQVDVRRTSRRDSFRGWKHFTKIPFEEKASSFDGCNCWGFLALIYRVKYKIRLKLFHEKYINSRDRHKIKKLLEKDYDDWIPVKVPQEGDVAKIRLRGSPFHIAIYIGKGRMMHIESCTTYPSISRVDSLLWRNRILGYYRHKDMF